MAKQNVVGQLQELLCAYAAEHISAIEKRQVDRSEVVISSAEFETEGGISNPAEWRRLAKWLVTHDENVGNMEWAIRIMDVITHISYRKRRIVAVGRSASPTYFVDLEITDEAHDAVLGIKN